MSESYKTAVNGEFVLDTVILRDGDEFCIANRQFKYQSGGKIHEHLPFQGFPSKINFFFTLKCFTEKDSHYDFVNENLVTRQISAKDAADEDETLDFAKHPLLKAKRGKPFTPLQEKNLENKSPFQKKLTPMATRQTPLKKVVRSPLRCKENLQAAADKEIEIEIASAAKPKKSPGKSLRNLNALTVKKSNDSIKQAISMRRRSYGPVSTIQSPGNEECDTPKEDNCDDITDGNSEKKNLRKVMNARRKSFSCLSTVGPLDTGVRVTVVPAVDVVEVEVKSADMQSPVAAVVEEVTEPCVISAGEAIVPEVEVVEQQEASLLPAPLNSPLRQAINARRRSSLSYTETAEVHSAEDQAQAVEKVTLIVKRDHLQQFASTHVSRRLSMGGRSAPVDGDAKAMKRKSIAAPRYQPSTRLPKPADEQNIDACVLAELAVDEEVDLTCSASDRKSMSSAPVNEGEDTAEAHTANSPVRSTLRTPTKPSAHREVAVKQALCVQLAVDAFASELEMQVSYLHICISFNSY